jgi:hypothetical protein
MGAIEVYTGTEWYNKHPLITDLAQVVVQSTNNAMGSGTGGGDLSSVTIGEQRVDD